LFFFNIIHACRRKKIVKPNIILVVIDALRARNLGCFGADPASSPNLDKMAADGILFENCYSCWNTTDQSLTSILSGHYPRTHGIVHHGDKITLDDLKVYEHLGISLLGDWLKQNGYQTMAVDWMGRWYKRGFDFYGYKPEYNFLQKLGYHLFKLPYLHVKYIIDNIALLKIYSKKRKTSIRTNWESLKGVLKTFRFTFELARIQDAGYVTSLAEQLIRARKDNPFFLFLHYWDTHSPYNCPKKFITEKSKKQTAVDLYLSKVKGAVRYVDHHMGRIKEVLSNEKILDNTLLIITSDHGESLTEHDIHFDHHGLYEVTTHVPLIFYGPGIFKEKKKINSLIQHIDIAPTLCDLLNIKKHTFDFDGSSLFPLIDDEKKELRDFIFNEESYVQRKIAIRTHKYKYIMAPDGRGFCNYCQKVHVGPEELYDLSLDPEETKSLIDQEKELAQEMKKQLESFVSALDKKREDCLKRGNSGNMPDKIMLDPEEEKKIRKRLRSLGYMD
jgi:arylsulfatase